MKHRIPSAFTLLELMVVIAIIALLAALAIPRYISYFDKARQTEVAMNLAALHTAQQLYWAEHGTYSTTLAGKEGIGWQPEGYRGGGKEEQFFYTYGFNVPRGQEGVNYFTGKLETPAQALGSSSADAHHFTIKAAAYIARTGRVDVWSINESRMLVHEQNGI